MCSKIGFIKRGIGLIKRFFITGIRGVIWIDNCELNERVGLLTVALIGGDYCIS